MKTVWRDLTAEELVLWPKAHLGGGLTALVACAGALTLIGLGMIAFGLYVFGPLRLLPELFFGVFDTLSPARRVGVIYAAYGVCLMVWSALFLIMTLSRASSTPVVASALFGLHFVLGVAAAVATQVIVAGEAAQPWSIAGALVPFVPTWLGGLMLTVGFSAYLLGGVRPNAYFRRRVATIGS